MGCGASMSWRGKRVTVAALTILAAMSGSASARAAVSAPPSPQPAVWAVTTPLPEALGGLAAAAVNNQIFVTGGTTSSPGFQVSAATWALSPSTSTWVPKAALPAPRMDLALVSDGGSLYALGGSDNSKPIAEVDRYDPTADQWTAVAPMPVPLDQPAATVGKDDRIYVVFIAKSGLQAEVYDTGSNTWSLTTPVAGALPLALTSAATGLDGRIYTFSSGDGCCNNGELGGGGFAFNPVTNVWNQLPQLRALPSNVWWGAWAGARRDPQGRIVMLGGWGNCSGACPQPYGSLSVYTPLTRQWSFGFDAPAEAAMPATVMVGSSLYSIGGTLAGQGEATSEVDVLPLSDATAPTVAAPPQMTIAPMDTVYTTSVPIRVVNDVTDPSGIAGAHLQRSVSGGPFTDVQSPWSGADTTVQRGTTYTYQEQYTDGAGNLSALSAGPTFTASVLEESYRNIKYSGSWTRMQVSGALGGYTRSATSPGASATFTFTGHSVRYVGVSTAQSGFAEIIVDGVLQGVYNLAPGAANSVPLTYSWASGGQHTIELINVRGGSGNRIDVDAFLTLS